MRERDSWARFLLSGEGVVYAFACVLVLAVLVKLIAPKEADDAEALQAVESVTMPGGGRFERDRAAEDPRAARRRTDAAARATDSARPPTLGSGATRGGNRTSARWSRQTHIVPVGAATLRVTQVSPSCEPIGNIVTYHAVGLTHRESFNQLFQLALDSQSVLSLFTVWHVDAPGAAEGSAALDAAALAALNPEALADQLRAALHTLNVGAFVGLGSGLGADVLLRFACSHPDAVLGLVLVRPCREPPVSAESMFLNAVGKALRAGWTDRAADLLVGYFFGGMATEGVRQAVRERVKEAHAGNTAALVDAVLHRDEVDEERLQAVKRLPMLLVVGGKPKGAYVFTASDPELGAVELQRALDRRVCSVLRLEGGPEPTMERPGELVHPMGLFVNGVGFSV